MTYDRYYYSILSPTDKQVYKKIYDGIKNFETVITVPKTTEPLLNIIQFIGRDNPHIFYVDFNQYNYSQNLLSTTVNLTYWYTKQEADEINERVHKVLQKMISRVTGATDYEKEKSVHDLLIENVLYDMSALQNLHKHSPRSNSILGVLFYKTAVCEGIAKVTKMLLNLLDIKCIVATGMAGGELHAWNIVKIDGKPYHLDVTWDINLSDEKSFRYDYFNLMDKDILLDHSPSIKYPACISNQDNYFIKNRLIVKNFLDIEKLIVLSRMHKNKGAYFKYIGPDFEKTVKNAVGVASSVKAFSGINRISYSVNKEQQICMIKL